MLNHRVSAFFRGLLPLAVIVGAALSASTTRGAFITYATPGGSTQGGQPVSATVDITTGNGTVNILLTNLQANPTSVIQNLSDLLVTFSNNVGATTISGSTAQEITVAGDGTFTLGSTVAPGWDLSNPQTNQIYLNVLGSAIGPAHTLIGPPGGSTYAAANGSIAGNGPHNPFLNQTISWTIAAPNVTSLTTVTGVTFSFGTSSGNTTPGVRGTTPVPEPSTLALLALGLPLGLLAHRRSRRAA